MRSLSSEGSQSGLRAKRFDAIILGGALPGLVVAIKLRMAGLRVLLLEESVGPRFPGFREPFFWSAGEGSVFSECTKDLGLALIDRKQIHHHPRAYQVVTPEARVDIGETAITADELVAWGLTKPEEAQALVRSLRGAAHAELDAMLNGNIVVPRGVVKTPSVRVPRFQRGLPSEIVRIPNLASWLDIQIRGLSLLAEATPPPEARARLLGAPLAGRDGFYDASLNLPELLGRRVDALRAERRLLRERFELVHFKEEAGVAIPEGRQVWLARVLVLNTPAQCLSKGLVQGEAGLPPNLLAGQAGCKLSLFHWRLPKQCIPAGMADRVIWLPKGESTEPILLQLFQDPADPNSTHLIAKTRGPEEIRSQLEQQLDELMPFSAEARQALPVDRPSWDECDFLEDPPPGNCWPGEIEVRRLPRPALYQLARGTTGALGAEGDLLLGWKAAERLVADLR